MDEQNPLTITITGTTVTLEGEAIIGFALNNLVNTLTATTDQSEEWNYTLTVHMIVQDVYNVINLNRSGQILFVDLTADMLPYSGRYEMQFVATNGDYVSHTDIFEVFVKNTLDPVKQYTPVPSEFYQIQKDVQQNAQLAQNSANQAEQSATQAGTSAIQASESETNAAESATQAQQSASAAQQSATSASESASEASISAQQAASSATAAQSAQQAIENMTVSSSPLPAGSDPTVTKTIQDDIVNLDFGLPVGGSGGSGGTSDYNDLINLPQINGVELIGNKTSAELGILKNPVTLANITVSGQGIKTIKESIQNIDDLYTVSVIIIPTEDFKPSNLFVGFSTPTGDCQIALINTITLNANKEFVISAERFTDFTISTGFLNASYMWLNKTAYYAYKNKVWSGATEFYMRDYSSVGFPEGTQIKVVGK